MRDVAGADDGDVFRHAEPGLPHGLHRADRRRIVGREHGVDARFEAEQLLHGFVAVRFHEPAAHDPLRVRLDPGRAERRAVAVRPSLRVHDRRPGDVRDGAPSLLDQMRRRQPAHLIVVGHDAVAAHVRVVVTIDHDDADALRGEALQEIGVAGGVRRGQDDAVHLALTQQLEFIALLARILVRAAQQQTVAARARDRFEAGDDLDEEGVHQIGDDDAERVRAAEGKAAGDGVGLIAEFGDFGEYAGAGGVADVLAVVQDLRDGGDRHPQLAGDPFHGGGRRHAVPSTRARVTFSVKVT